MSAPPGYGSGYNAPGGYNPNPGGYNPNPPPGPYNPSHVPGGYNPPAPGGYNPQAPGGYNPHTAAPGGYNPQAPGGYNPSGPGGYNPQGTPGYNPPPPGPGGYGGPPAGYGAPYGGQPPPAGVSPELWQWFQSVDGDRNGKIAADELRNALMNGDWSPFNPETCRLMIGMFDKDRNGTIDIHEFSALWKYIQDWKGCFDKFDLDRSGNIDANELQNAFKTFGYNLSTNFCTMCVRVFDRQSVNSMKFDDFIQCCVMLKTLTDKFREKDTNMSGVVNIHYEDFLRMVLDNTIVGV